MSCDGEWREVSQRYPVLVRSLLIGSAIVAVLSIAGPLWYLTRLQADLPDDDAIARIGEMDQATTVYDGHDQLAFTIFNQRRMDASLSSVSPHLIHAIIAIEDQRFYDHGGFDVLRTASAALSNLREHRAVQGGSTITQQLARQSFLKPDKTIRRKLQELILASRIEAKYSKGEILELYLNKVYFGDGLYGVEAASQGYFGKRAAELSVSEAALLAGLVKSPSRYAPTVDMERAVARRNVVLQAMLENGAIDRSTWESARASKVVLEDGLRAGEPHGQYFKEQVRLELVERFGWERVYQRRTARVHDARHADADGGRSGNRRVAEDDRRPASGAGGPPGSGPEDHRRSADPSPLQAALVAMEPGTGYVRAMVGGRDFNASRFNRAVQARRQPGSAFKPFVYAAALEAGYTPASVIDRLERSHRDAPGGVGTGRRTFDRRVDDAAHRPPNVQQPRRRPPAAGNRNPPRGAVRTDDGRGRRAERPVSGTRLRRSHAGIDDRRLRRVRQSGQGSKAHRHPARRRSRRPAALRGAGDVGPGHQRDDGVPDVEHAGRRHQRRHRGGGERRSASSCRRRERPARPTITTTRGSSATRRSSSPACGWASTSRAPFFQTGMPRMSPSRSGRRS